MTGLSGVALIVSSVESGRKEEAAVEAAEAVRFDPNFSLE